MNEFSKLDTPLGTLGVRTNSKGVHHIHLPNDVIFNEIETLPKNQSKILNQALDELQEYFTGKRDMFTVPIDLDAPPFYKKVLQEVGKVPFGSTASYLEIASRVGSPKAVRAVGSANARNPIPIIIPCHRIIRSDGGLGGYGGGLDLKMDLLKHEDCEFLS